MLIRRLRLALLGAAATCLALGGQQLQAQWGTNAPPCNGPCVPVRQTWGYYKTRWHQWPCATYSSPSQPSSEVLRDIPSTELPPPSGEAEIRVPTPSRRQFEQPSPRSGFEPGTMPIPDGGAMRPSPREVEAAPGMVPDRSNINEVPMTLPPAEPTPGPMGSNRPLREASPPNPTALPRLRLRTSGADNVATNVPATDKFSGRGADVRTVRSTYDPVNVATNSSLQRAPQTELDEPALLMPPLPSRQIEFRATTNELRQSSSNPLRSAVVQASANEETDELKTTEDGPSPVGGTIRPNPLRR